MARSPKLLIAIGVIVLAVLLEAIGNNRLASGQPVEVRTLQSVLQRLRRANDLGTQPIAFMVSSGTYTAQLAEQRGLCKTDQCTMFVQLNPYQRYGNGWDELIRQGYALGDIEAWTASSGTIVIPRATFRAYAQHTGYLACTLAHEIAHYRRYHIFAQSYHMSHKLAGLPEKQRTAAEMNYSRQQELEADRDSASMLRRAGYPGRVCEEGLNFMHHSVGDGRKTEEDSTHPGYDERLAAIRTHYDQLDKKAPKPQASRPAGYAYDPTTNLLTMTPW